MFFSFQSGHDEMQYKIENILKGVLCIFRYGNILKENLFTSLFLYVYRILEVCKNCILRSRAQLKKQYEQLCVH